MFQRLMVQVTVLSFVFVAAVQDVRATCPATTGDQLVCAAPDGMTIKGPVLRASTNLGSTYAVAYGYIAMDGTGMFGRLFSSSNHDQVGDTQEFDTKPNTSGDRFICPDIASLSSSGGYRWVPTWHHGVVALVWDSWYQYYRRCDPSLIPIDASEIKLFARPNPHYLQAVDGLPASGWFASVFGERAESEANISVWCKAYNADGVLQGSSILETHPEWDMSHDVYPAVSATWYNADKIVAAWGIRQPDGGTAIKAQVLDQYCQPLSSVATVDTCYMNSWDTSLVGVAAFASGFVVVWEKRIGTNPNLFDSYYRSYDLSANPIIDARPVDTSDPTGGRWFPKVAGAPWGPPGFRPTPYFVVTWRRWQVPNEYPEMKLFKGLYPPQAASPITSITTIADCSNDQGFSPDLFTGCSSDIRVGVAWGQYSVGFPQTVMKRFHAFVPAGLAMAGGSGDAAESVHVAPGITVDNPDEPDLIFPLGSEFDSTIF